MIFLREERGDFPRIRDLVFPGEGRVAVVRIEVPFANHPGDVAGASQPVGEGWLSERQWAVAVGDEAEAVLVATRQETRARRAALRGGDVAAGETHSLGGEAVDVRGFHILFETHAREIRVAVVIGEEDDDVRLGRCEKRLRQEQQRDQAEEISHGGVADRLDEGSGIRTRRASAPTFGLALPPGDDPCGALRSSPSATEQGKEPDAAEKCGGRLGNNRIAQNHRADGE